MTLRWLLAAAVTAVGATLRLLAPGDPGGVELVSLGVLLVGGLLAGDLAERVRLPRVTGYLVVGMALGPSLLGVVPMEDVHRLSLFEEVALGLIALTAGGEFSWKVVRSRWRLLTGVTLAHTLGLGSLVAGLAWLGLGWSPFLGPLSEGARAAAALLLGVIAVAKSPATTIAVITETRARGPLVDAVLGVTILKDLVLLLLFAVASGLAHRWVGSGAARGGVGALLVDVTLSLGLGVLVGAGLGAYLRWVGRHAELLLVALALLAAEVGTGTHLEPLLLCMAAGFTARNLFPAAAEPFLQALEKASPPLYVIFFALVGAALPLGVLLAVGPAALLLAGTRLAGIWAFTRLPAAVHRAPASFQRWGWTGFVAQAGLSLGLASRVRSEMPGFGEVLATLVVGAVVINQLVGPVLWRWGLTASGEAGAVSRSPAQLRDEARP